VTLRVTEAHKSYRSRTRNIVALKGVDIAAAAEELLVVVGPSGSGKSTLLRAVAGLEELDSGTVEIAGRDVTHAAPGERNVAMVFQEYALYPHLSVFENIAFGLRARRAAGVEEAVREAADHLGLTDALERRPDEVSGGERQRVALARALVRRPVAFLMDEPLSNLDAELRLRMRAEIRDLHRRAGATTLYVTHDQIEAMTMGDRVAVLRDGTVEQVAPPGELYERPGNVFVARFIGNPPMNILPAGLLGAPDGTVTVGLRPERMALVRTNGRLHGRVVMVEGTGADALVHVDAGGHALVVRTTPQDAPEKGSEAAVAFADQDVHAFDSAGGRIE
jgi:ABC-type sugar transport system ATPase subunit